jgi:hypothetical protein
VVDTNAHEKHVLPRSLCNTGELKCGASLINESDAKQAAGIREADRSTRQLPTCGSRDVADGVGERNCTLRCLIHRKACKLLYNRNLDVKNDLTTAINNIGFFLLRTLTQCKSECCSRRVIGCPCEAGTNNKSVSD